jgi:hypothetical protein
MSRPRTKLVSLHLTLLVATLASPALAQSSSESPESAESAAGSGEAASEKPSKRDLFFDPDDGALDLSAFLATKRGFMPVGGIITEPAVGYGATLGLMFLHDSIQNRAETVRKQSPDGALERLPPPSISWGGGFATQNGSWGAGLAHLGIFKEDRYRYRGALFYSGVNLDFYGEGGELDLPIDSVAYTLDGWALIQQVTRRVGETDLFLGANFKYMSFDTKLDLGLDLQPPDWFPSLERRITTSGIGILAEYDSRNTIFTPDTGIHGKLETVFYAEGLGSDRDFRKGSAVVRGWKPLAADWVLGLRADLGFSGGDTPFYMLPAIDIRGIPKNRYQGENALTLEAELRWDFTPRWSLVGFFGSGWAAREGADFVFNQGHVAGGTGFRYLISRIFGIRTGMDFAWSEEDFAFYFTTGTAWGDK